MTYSEEYKKAVDEYGAILELYNKQIASEGYVSAQERLCFDFLEAKQRVEMLTLYKQLGEKSEIRFRNADEAASFYISLGEIKKSIPTLLDGAAHVEKANEYLDRLNALVDASPYLSEDLKIEKQEALANLAKECLSSLPGYPKLVTKKFRESFVKGCAKSLGTGGIKKLALMGILKAGDLETVESVSKESGGALRDFFADSLEAEASETIIARLRGTSYSNEDGVSRQVLLSEEMKSPEKGPYTAVKTTWEKDGVTKPAVEVRKNGSLFGYIPQEVVDGMEEKYSSPSYTIDSMRIAEGNGFYGAEMQLTVKGKLAEKDAHIER